MSLGKTQWEWLIYALWCLALQLEASKARAWSHLEAFSVAWLTGGVGFHQGPWWVCWLARAPAYDSSCALGFLTTWWPDSKGRASWGERWGLHCMLWPSLKVTQHHFYFSCKGPPSSAGGVSTSPFRKSMWNRIYSNVAIIGKYSLSSILWPWQFTSHLYTCKIHSPPAHEL